MRPIVRQLLVVLLARSALLAGCAGPGGDVGDDQTGLAEQTLPTNDSEAGTATPDNDAGAESVNPPAGQNGTNGTDENVERNESSPADATQTDDGQGA